MSAAATADNEFGFEFPSLSKIFSWASKIAFVSFPLVVAGSLVFDPTWLKIFHDTANVVAQSFINKIDPYTSWLPYHLGFSGEGGLLYGFMQWFLEDEIYAMNLVQNAAGFSAPVNPGAVADIAIPGL